MVFRKDHPLLLPKDTGIPFGTFTDDELRALSADLTVSEQKLPHAEYHARMPAPLPNSFKNAIAGPPMDPSKGFAMQDYGKYMNTDGHCEVENGYCVLPNGITYAAALIRQEDLTDEMVDYYNRYFAPEESLFYKTWMPGYHYLHYSNGCVEDFGFGRMNMKFMGMVQLEDLGIIPEDVEKNDPACISISGTTTLGYNLDSRHPEVPEWNTIIFYSRKTDYGRELRIRLYYGEGLDNGRRVFTPPAPEEAENIARCTMIHIMQEYTNDLYLERAFWDDLHRRKKNA